MHNHIGKPPEPGPAEGQGAEDTPVYYTGGEAISQKLARKMRGGGIYEKFMDSPSRFRYNNMEEVGAVSDPLCLARTTILSKTQCLEWDGRVTFISHRKEVPS